MSPNKLAVWSLSLQGMDQPRLQHSFWWRRCCFVVLRMYGDIGMFIGLIIHDLPTHDQQCSIFSYHGYSLDRPCQTDVPLNQGD